MKLHILSLLTLATSSAYAMQQVPAPTETPLHRAAKAGNYAACFGIIKHASLVDLGQIVPQEQLEDFNDMIDVYDSTKSPKSQSKEFKDIQKRMLPELKHPQALITALCAQQVEQVRAQKDQHGHIPLDYVPQTASAALRALLKPMNSTSMVEVTNQPLKPMPGDTLLHCAAKIGSYRDCFDILTESIGASIQPYPQYPQYQTIKSSYIQNKPLSEQTEEYKAAIKEVAEPTIRCQMMNKMMQKLTHGKNARSLRTAKNKAGLTPIACVPSHASQELRDLLHPDNFDMFAQFITETSIIDTITIDGHPYPCDVFKLTYSEQNEEQ